MKIPKIIHYCWFGKGEKSDLIKKCIKSWSKYCPDYQIIEWNEEQFDIYSHRFTKEAYEMGKYAFVSDYVRLYALYKYGGIYVDTDLEIRKNIDHLLEYRAFSGFEIDEFIPTAIMGAEEKHPWIGMLLDYYKDKSFILDSGEYNMTPNPRIITKMTKERYSLVLNNKEQLLEDGICIFPDYVLCNNVIESKNLSIHHFEGSWLAQDYKPRYLQYKKNYTILHTIINKTKNNMTVDINFENKNRIFLFGQGFITEHYIELLKQNKVDIAGIIVREKSRENFGLKEVSMSELNQLTKEDLIIVIPSFDFNSICEELRLKTDAEIISIEYTLGVRILY